MLYYEKIFGWEKSMQTKSIIFPILIVIFLSAFQPVSASTKADISDNEATLNFPNSITFDANIQSSLKITSVVLEYGDQEETCSQVIAKAFPKFTPDTFVRVYWTWDMHQSGSLPPGTQIWWRWRYTDESGHETVSEQKTITWLDSIHHWQTLTEGDIRLHWYQSDQSFAHDLINAAYGGLMRVEKDAGLTTDQPVDMYIYANTSDMKASILYEPSWTGGEAFPEYNIVIIGISPSDLSWGRRAEVHELTHVLVGHFTFACLSVMPTWLNEGLAVYSEGDLDPASQKQLDQAVAEDQLLSIRSLSSGFSEEADKANLSYSESYNVVKFLIGTYGRDKMNALLTALRDGSTVDEALKQDYGFDVEGLDGAWRQSIGARPYTVSAKPTQNSTPTIVPTIVPVSGALLANTPTPTSLPTPVAAIRDQSDRSWMDPLALDLGLVSCVLLVIFVAMIIGFVLIIRKRPGGKNEKPS